MEFCQKIAAGEIKLEDLQSAYDAEDDAKERAVFREVTERAKKFHARLDAMGLKYRDLLELESIHNGLNVVKASVLEALAALCPFRAFSSHPLQEWS